MRQRGGRRLLPARGHLPRLHRSGGRAVSGQAADTAPDTGATVNSWVNVVRRAHLDETMKPIALLLASYANKDGTSIHPGVARLAVQSGKSYRTVQRVLARLRAIGLIEAMPRVKTPRGWKDGYRLILAADLLDKLDVPTPAAEDAAIEAIASRERERVRKYRREHRPGGPAKRHLDGITGSTAKRHLDGVTDATTIRHSDGVTSSDDTPKLRATCNATGN